MGIPIHSFGTTSTLDVKEFLDHKDEVYKLAPEGGSYNGAALAKIQQFEAKYLAPSQTSSHFQSITFGKNQNYLVDFADFAMKHNNAHHIKEIRLSVHDLCPLDGLENIDARGRPEEIGSWAQKFHDGALGLFEKCKNLRVLRLDGFLGINDSARYERQLHLYEEHFISQCINLLNKSKFSELKELHFRLAHLIHLQRLWQLYNTEPGQILTKNISTVDTIHFYNPYYGTILAHSSEIVQHFLAWIERLKLTDITLIPDKWERSDISIAPLAIHNIWPRSLQLKKVDITDIFSSVLRGMRLDRIRLSYVTLDPDKDKWEYVFKALNQMESLKPVHMHGLRYHEPLNGSRPCKYKGMCSHLPTDRLEYLELAKKADVVVLAGRESDGGFRGLCYCLDEMQGINSRRELEDIEADSDPEVDSDPEDL